MEDMKQTLLNKREELVKLASKVELDSEDGVYALEKSKEAYYQSLETNATEKMLKAAEEAQNIEINRILQERESELKANNTIYNAQIDLIDELLKLF